jgi:5,6-dimethylbenzimidazole synthase
MQIDDFLDLARKRRSIRRFKPDTIPDEQIEKILEAGRWAMSGANAQPWEFVVIRNPEIKKKVNDVRTKYLEMEWIVEQTRLQEMRQPHFRTDHPGEIEWTDAPVIIATIGDIRTIQASCLVFRFFENHTFDQNMANTTQMINLAAAALGLGAAWISLTSPMSQEIGDILGVPPVLSVFTLIPLGYPASKPAPYRRKLSELIHYDTYDKSRFRDQNDIQEFIKFLRRRHEEGRAYA